MANRKSGTLCQRADGNFVVTFDKKKFVRAKKKDAELLLKQLREDESNGYKFEDFEKVTIKDGILKWLTENRRKVKPTTFDRKEEIVKNQIIPQIGYLQVGILTTKNINEMLINLANDNLSYSVVKKAFNYLNQFYRDTEMIEKFKKNPFKGVIIPDANKKAQDDIVFYTKPELDKICETAISSYTDKKGKNHRHYRLGYAIVILAKTGIRSSEILGLTWDDIDFNKKLMHVIKDRVIVKDRDSKHQKKYISLVQSTKTKSSKRHLPMSEEVYNAFKQLYLLTSKNEYVLSNVKGNPIYPRNLDRMFREILVRAGFNEYTTPGGKVIRKIYGVHSLRHSFATYLINEKKVNINIVSKWLGHKEVTVTLNTYTHTTNEDFKKLVKII